MFKEARSLRGGKPTVERISDIGKERGGPGDARGREKRSGSAAKGE